MSIKKAILTIHPMIRNALLLVPVFLVLVLYFLQEGIYIDSLKVGNYKLQGLYLKLNNRLTLKVDKTSIPKEHNKDGLGDIDSSLRKLKKVLTYFEYIELGSVKYTNDKYRIVYADDTIYIDSNDYEIAGMIVPQKGGMVATIPLVRIKKYDLTLHGDMTYAYDSEKFTFSGDYKLLNLEGKVRVEVLDNKLSFLLDSKEADDIGRVLDMFKIPEETRVWIDKRVQAEKYRLVTLRGEGLLQNNDFSLNMNKTEARAELKNVKIIFDPGLNPVKSRKVTVRLHNDRLDFDLEEPYYNKKNMTGSKVALLHLTGEKHTELLLKLKFNCRYDKEIDEILGVYDIKVPLRQRAGIMKAEIDIDVDLESKETKTEGRVLLSKGVIVIGGAPLKVYGGEVTFTSNRVALWSVGIYDRWYRGLVSGVIDLNTQKADLVADINHLNLGDKKRTSIIIKNKKRLTVKMDFRNKVRFDIPAYRLKIESLKKGGIRVINSDIKPFLRHIVGLPIQIENGKFVMTTSDYKSYDFKGEVKWKHSYIYDKSGYISKIPFDGRYKDENMNIKALGGKFLYDSSRSLIKIEKINIDAKKMIGLYISEKSKQLNKLNVQGSNSIIRYGKHVLLTDSFDLSISGRNTTFSALKDGDRVRVDKNGNSLVVYANKIKDRMLSALINFGGLRGGRYSLKLLGDVDGEMNGVIDIEGGAVESFKAYNDLIALFNTIPALMTLSDPGFSKKGYVVRDGKIEFRILPEKVMLDNIYINGKSSTIAGKGSVGLESGELNIDLAVRTAREVGKVLGSLPLVGYILFGKDKSVTTGVKIVGTMDKPKAKTHPVQEALLYPFELIKRTVTSPAHIINN